MPKTRSGRSTENTNRNHQSQGASVPSPPLSSQEAALPPPPQSAPQYTLLQTSCTTSQQAPQVEPSTSPSSSLTSSMDSAPDNSVKSLIGTLVHVLQQITQEPRPVIWYNELREANAPTFIGAPDPFAAEKWIKDMEKMYRAMEVPHDKWVNLAVSFLSGNAEMWYETIEAVYGQIHDWATFKDHFYKNYFPMPARNQKITEFVNLKQGSMTVFEYAHKFFVLGKFVPDVMEDELLKIGKFEEGFNYVIKSGLIGQRANDFSDLLEKAIRVENMSNILGQTTAGVKRTLEADQTPAIRVENMSNILAQTTAGVKRNLEADPQTYTVTTLVNNKKPTVTIHTFPQCQKCVKPHFGECRVCYQCGQTGHVRNSCPNRGQTQISAQTTSPDGPRRGKRKCPGREPIEVDETNATDQSADNGSVPEAPILLESSLEDSHRCESQLQFGS